MNTFDIKNHYRSRYVAYVDILGFREKINGIDEDSSLFEQIQHIQDHIGMWTQSVGRQRQLDGELPNPPDVQATAFSDTVVFSANHNSFGLFNVVYFATNFCRRMLEFGALTRGGLASGLLHHRENVIFGKSFLDAYDIECKVAKYPRVAIHPVVSAEFKRIAPRYGRAAELIETDFDGIEYLNVFAAYETDAISFIAKTYAGARDTIDREFRRKLEFGLWQKVTWLAAKYNAAVEANPHLGATIDIPPFTKT